MERTSIEPGRRCRTVHAIPHPKGRLDRNSEGTVLAYRENLGRQLITVGFDAGMTVVLFPHEVELTPHADASSEAV
jgi:hypothetical protein